jgi:hypothetical protein
MVFCLDLTRDAIVGEAIVVIRRLVSGGPASLQALVGLINHFIKQYEQLTVPMAKASILWLTARHISSLEKQAPDTLRVALKHFNAESTIVKLFILNLSTVLFIMHKRTNNSLLTFSELCFQYSCKLASFDIDVEVRDFGRFISKIMLIDSNYSNDIFDIFQGSAPKAIISPSSGLDATFLLELDDDILGSLAFVMGTKGGHRLNNWALNASGFSERNVSVFIF